MAYDRDGGVKFSATGRPVMKVAPDLSKQVTIVRENFRAGLEAYTGTIQQEMPGQYQAQVLAAQKAGEPIHTKDMADQAEAMSQRLQHGLASMATPEPATPGKRHKVATAA